MKDKRELILVFNRKDVNTIIEALEIQASLEDDDHSFYGSNATKLVKKIKEVMRLE